MGREFAIVAGLISKLSEMIARRKWRKLHPAVGLPKDAPEHLETDNGSFIRPCPENDEIPFRVDISSGSHLAPIIGIGGLCIVWAIAHVARRYENLPPYDDIFFGLMMLSLLLTVSSLFMLLLKAERSLKKAPDRLLRRGSRMFDPEDASIVAGVDPPGERKKQVLIPDEVAVVRAIPGYLEFEMSRAQVRVAAEDMKFYLGKSTSSWGSGLNIRCDFGDFEWSVVVGKFQFLPKAAQPKLRLFQGLRGEQPAQSLARYLQRSMGIPEEDTAYPPETETLPKVALPLVLSVTPSTPVLENLFAGCVFGAIPFIITTLLLLLLIEILPPPGRGTISYWAAAMLFIVLIFWWPARKFLRYIRMRQRGTWTFEDDGITYKPFDRPGLHILWDEVRWVRWSDSGVELVESRETIRIDSYSFRRAEVKKVRQVIQNKLAGNFNLSTRSPIRSRLLSRAYMVSILAMFIILPLVLSVLRDRWDDVGGVIALLIIAVFVLPCILFTWWIKRQDKRLNPEWRERRKGTGDPAAGSESDLRKGGEEG